MGLLEDIQNSERMTFIPKRTNQLNNLNQELKDLPPLPPLVEKQSDEAFLIDRVTELEITVNVQKVIIQSQAKIIQEQDEARLKSLKIITNLEEAIKNLWGAK